MTQVGSSSSDFRNIRSRGTSRMSYSSPNTHGVDYPDQVLCLGLSSVLV